MLRHFILIVIHLIIPTFSQNVSLVYTEKLAQACREYICRDGYNYKTFYSIDNEDFKEIRKDSNTVFEMHIGIQASSNGHILLSPVAVPGYTDPVYEIVVGGGGNQFTELRRNLKRNARSSVKTPKILSSLEIRAFYIKISEDGLIEFGKDGETLPLLSYMDSFPLDIKYFSFAAWTGVEAKFLFDCPIPTGKGSLTPDSQEVEAPMSMSDQLKRSRLLYRYPWIPPKSVVDVRLGVKVTNVKFDAFESKLITSMSIVTSWTDDSMAWYPDKYNGTIRLKFRQGQIWKPQFYVFNSDKPVVFETRNSDLISMVYSGEATFHFQTQVKSWCTDSPPGLSRWPRDEHLCSIVIQPWEAHERINIDIIDPKDTMMQVFADIDEVIENEWEVVTRQAIIRPTVWNRVYIPDDNQTHQSDRLIINLNLKRRATTYNIVFYTPLLVLMTFVLISFWSEPLTMDRVWFFAGCNVVVCTGLCFIDYLIPSHTVPSILVLYITVLGGILLALLIQVLLITTEIENIGKSQKMQKILKSHIFRTIFCLPDYVGSSDQNGGYSLQEDEDPQSTSMTRDVEEMESDNERTFSDKKELAEIIDRVLFVVYSITFAVMLAAHF